MDPEANLFGDPKKQKHKKGKSSGGFLSSIFSSSLNQDVGNDDDFISNEQELKSYETVMNNILNSVFTCLGKLMENEMAPEFYKELSDKINKFQFMKVISRVLTFFNFTEHSSAKLNMQKELLSKIEIVWYNSILGN